MKIERNVKVKERRAILRHIDYRVHKTGRKSTYVRVRGHKISHQKLDRWSKESSIDQQHRCTSPQSPLPSGISIYTNSLRGSPTLMTSSLSDSPISSAELMNSKAMRSALVRRLFTYAQTPNRIIHSQGAQAIFNDLQVILSCKRGTCKKHGIGAWNPALEKDITRLRNLINMDVNQKLVMEKQDSNAEESFSVNVNKTSRSRLVRRNHHYASWKTPYCDVAASFWTTQPVTYTTLVGQEVPLTNAEELTARIVLVPNTYGRNSLRVICDFDFTPNVDPFTKITYQATIPNESEVFTTVASGEVRGLLELLESGIASLNDRDEQGRSLLNYAIYNAHVEMCLFLVERNADVDSIEPDALGYFGPVHSIQSKNDAEIDEEECHEKTSCLKVMLQAGGDPSLQVYLGGGDWSDCFTMTIEQRSVTALKHMLDLGEPFINSRSTCKEFLPSENYEYSPLISLADDCGYTLGGTLDIVDKAILLIQREADISCRRPSTGNTVLHTLLGCRRYHERISRKTARRRGTLRRYNLSLTEPMDLLLVFITACADVYAIDNHGNTPSIVAREYNREEEWINALKACGYDAEEVLGRSDPTFNDPQRIHQTSKLPFEEYCQRRSERLRFAVAQVELDIVEGENDEDSDDEGSNYGLQNSKNSDLANSDTPECECDPEWAKSDMEIPVNDGRYATTAPNGTEFVHKNLARNVEDIEGDFHDMSMGARHDQVLSNEYAEEGFDSTYFEMATLFADDFFNLNNDNIVDFQNTGYNMYDVSGEQSGQKVIDVVGGASPGFNGSLTGELLDFDNKLDVETIDYGLQEQDNTELNDQEVMAGYGGDDAFQEMDFALDPSLMDDMRMLEEFVEFETMVNF